MSGHTLEVRNLSTHFATRAGLVKAVDGVSFHIGRGEVLGLVGESGSGKSVTGFSLLGLVDPPGRVAGGEIIFQGRNLVGLPDAARRQRVAIAIALLHKPDLIIADEPTTALDVTIQAQILAEVQKLARDNGTALMWITHDLSVVAGLADRIAVMYAGRIVETGSVADVLDRPMHPYTAGLIGSVPSRNRRGTRLRQIPGMTPSLIDLPEGCAFRTRCPRADAACARDPESTSPAPGRALRCFHPQLDLTA